MVYWFIKKNTKTWYCKILQWKKITKVFFLFTIYSSCLLFQVQHCLSQILLSETEKRETSSDIKETFVISNSIENRDSLLLKVVHLYYVWWKVIWHRLFLQSVVFKLICQCSKFLFGFGDSDVIMDRCVCYWYDMDCSLHYHHQVIINNTVIF